MGMRNPAVFRWRPVGLSDSRDGLSSFPGACRSLQNFVPDPLSGNLWAARPAASQLVNLAGVGSFTSSSVISLLFTTGPYVFGLASISAGTDAPFLYNSQTNSFITIGGSTTFPTTIANATRPQAVQVGPNIVVSHPGAPSATPILWLSIANPAAPTWNAAQMTATSGGTATPLPTAPQAVGSFYNRAWYAVGNTVYFSNPLYPAQQTQASQSLTIGGQSPVTGFCPQGISTSTQGILGALLVFKAGSVWQITGDLSLSNLALNQLTASVGCSSPLTAIPTPAGSMFVAPDGVRSVPSLGMVVTPPNPDVVLPFYQTQAPYSAVAAFAANTYRVSLDTITADSQTGRFEYWHSMNLGKWSGPHTNAPDVLAPFGQNFVSSYNNQPGIIFQSSVYPNAGATYVELGSPLTWKMLSAPLDLKPPMSQKASVEASLLYSTGNISGTIQLLESSGGLIGNIPFQFTASTNTWGESGLTWGQFGLVWAAPNYSVVAGNLAPSAPIVAKFPQLLMTANSDPFFRFSLFEARYEALGYTGSNA